MKWVSRRGKARSGTDQLKTTLAKAPFKWVGSIKLAKNSRRTRGALKEMPGPPGNKMNRRYNALDQLKTQKKDWGEKWYLNLTGRPTRFHSVTSFYLQRAGHGQDGLKADE